MLMKLLGAVAQCHKEKQVVTSKKFAKPGSEAWMRGFSAEGGALKWERGKCQEWKQALSNPH